MLPTFLLTLSIGMNL